MSGFLGVVRFVPAMRASRDAPVIHEVPNAPVQKGGGAPEKESGALGQLSQYPQAFLQRIVLSILCKHFRQFAAGGPLESPVITLAWD
jgi:hypothetical protein